ncbi:unnamed protein product [Urochloa humidicola]
MSEDIVFEILVRLPVEELLRFQTVCKAWRAIITEPRFIRMHLQRSASKNKKCFLIVPHTLDSVIEGEMRPSTFSNNIQFYQWQEDNSTARFLLAKDFHKDFGSVYRMIHRHGLVLFPTNTKVYVINPAIRDVLVLPDGRRDILLPSRNYPQTIDFGLDPRTNKYKVARFFYRAINFTEQSCSVGMEVLTICGDGSDASWRETLEDPPYPVHGFRVSAYFKGSLFWIIGSYTIKRTPTGLLRFNLEDESFSLVPLPDSAFDDELVQIMEHGEKLYLAQSQSPQHLVIWMFCDDRSHHWIQLYSFNILEPFNLHSATMLHDGLYFCIGSKLFRCRTESGDVKVVACMDQLRHGRETAASIEDTSSWVNVHTFNWMPYTQSLVPVTRARCDKASHKLLQ